MLLRSVTIDKGVHVLRSLEILTKSLFREYVDCVDIDVVVPGDDGEVFPSNPSGRKDTVETLDHCFPKEVGGCSAIHEITREDTDVERVYVPEPLMPNERG
jgi:hypothetical protein